MDISLDAIQDSDFANVIQAIKDVQHFASAAPLKANKGLKRKTKRADELGAAKESLAEAMSRLITSPYTQSPPGSAPLVRGKAATTALRSLWAVLQEVKGNVGQEPLSEDMEDYLRLLVQNAVETIDPERIFLEEESQEEIVPPRKPTRRSDRLATQDRKNYNEKQTNDSLAELVGDLDVEEEEDA